MDTDAQIKAFLEGDGYAVAGASTNRAKYGNKVVRVYQQIDRTVYPVNPRADQIEGVPCYASLADVPGAVHGLSIITPPKITEQIVREAIDLGIQHIWCQPGAESPAATALAEEAGVNMIAGGPCLLVVLGYREGG
jgi:predicted CoA-binding protein